MNTREADDEGHLRRAWCWPAADRPATSTRWSARWSPTSPGGRRGGYHRGAGSPHAEIDALRLAARSVYVSLEPCSHRGRTGPCVNALVDAGVARVVFGQADPNPVAAGGAAVLEAAGVRVRAGVLAAEAIELNRTWTHLMLTGRPFVTWKFAATLDGRSAARDGLPLDHRSGSEDGRPRREGALRGGDRRDGDGPRR